ncbi:MAG: alcohol dehydrogenase catalytic domain-containing protein, partial [Bradyrhizobium sp.]
LPMRTARISDLGQPPAVAETGEPEPAAGETLVAVEAVALNALDLTVGRGAFYRGHPPLPYAVGCEAAGRTEHGKPEDTDWKQIDLLYGALELVQPSPVVTLNRAVAVSKARGPEAALEMIEPLAPRLANYFHFFGVRGAFLMQLGRNEEARVAFDRAIALANTSAEAAHIRMHLDRLMRDSQGAKISKK